MKAKLYRQIPNIWVLKSATISETKSGRIFCTLLYKFDVPEPAEVLPTLENSIGLDYSSPLFYVDHENRSPDLQHHNHSPKHCLFAGRSTGLCPLL